MKIRLPADTQFPLVIEITPEIQERINERFAEGSARCAAELGRLFGDATEAGGNRLPYGLKHCHTPGADDLASNL